MVLFRRGEWGGTCVLDGEPVEGIAASLQRTTGIKDSPKVLRANDKLAYVGPFAYGSGFVISPAEGVSMRRASARNAEVLRPYLTGEDINNNPGQIASREVIWFAERTEAEASTYQAVFQHLERHVRPFRLAKNPPPRDMRMRTQWWKFFHPRLELIQALAARATYCARSQVSARHIIGVIPSTVMPCHFVVVFLGDTDEMFPLVQSSLHEAWVVSYASSLGGTTNTRYIVKDCFQTFPLPVVKLGATSVVKVGREYREAREEVANRGTGGLNGAYRMLDDATQVNSAVMKFREACVQMDRAVAGAYGWDDVCLRHGFHETRQGVRFTVSELARREILCRLSALNHERYGEEVRQGLHESEQPTGSSAGPRSKRVSTKRATSAPAIAQQIGFGFSEPLLNRPKPEMQAKPPTGDDARAALSRPARALLKASENAGQPLGKAALLEAAKLDDGDWAAAIRELLDAELVRQTGEGRGTKYVARR